MKNVSIGTLPDLKRIRLKSYSAIGILTDENTQKLCYPLIKDHLPSHHVLVAPSGEENKTLTTCTSIWQQLTDLKFDRHGILLILGGGVLGDMGGFCAATYKRGIDFVILPTTLLAQVDASVGGKLGIDFGSLKNHIGVFQLPRLTAIGTQFLDTLPERELRSGFAEVIKHCIISDKRMWHQLAKKSLKEQNWLRLVRHSVAFKSRVVLKDPREKGLRKILNFGHTIGHALESYFLKTGARIFHGEAIAAGMIMESHIAAGKKLLTHKESDAIAHFILSLYGKMELPTLEQVLPLMQQDKKNKGNKILMALPKGIGKAVWDVPVSPAQIEQAMSTYQALQT